MARLAAAQPAGGNITLRLTTGKFEPHKHATQIVGQTIALGLPRVDAGLVLLHLPGPLPIDTMDTAPAISQGLNQRAIGIRLRPSTGAVNKYLNRACRSAHSYDARCRRVWRGVGRTVGCRLLIPTLGLGGVGRGSQRRRNTRGHSGPMLGAP